MIFHNAAKRIASAPKGSDHRSADRISLLFRALELPTKGVYLVKILGESGKSACAAMLSHRLAEAKLRVGCLTTPFSHVMTECVMLNGKPIDMDTFASCVSRVCAAANEIENRLSHLPTLTEEEEEALSPAEKALRAYGAYSTSFSLFADELLLMSAMLCFAEASCQVVLLEIPTGDRSGAYRLPITTAVSLVTSTESTDVAGKICRSLDKTTREVVTAPQQKAVYSLIADACAKINCRLSMPLRSSFYPKTFSLGSMNFYYQSREETLNTGAYFQAINQITVRETLEALKRTGVTVPFLSSSAITVASGAGAEMQFSFLSLFPTVILDFANTPSRIKAFADALTYHSERLGTQATVITEASADPQMAEDAIKECFLSFGIPVDTVICISSEEIRRTLKPITSSLATDRSLFILGSRPFAYEANRAFRDLML